MDVLHARGREARRPRQAGARAPQRPWRCELNGLRGCGVYQDAWTHDERLCLANVTAAAEAGATVLNYAEVVDLRIVSGRVAGAEVRDHIAGEASRSSRGRSSTRRARGSRHCAGSRSPASRHTAGCPRACSDAAARRAVVGGADDSSRPGPRDVRVSVGGHAPARHDGHPLRGRPRRRRGDGGGRRPVLGEAAVAVDGSLLRRDRILSTYAGLRVLPGSDGTTVDARRETASCAAAAGCSRSRAAS